MPRKKKPFIDRKNATVYRLIPGFVPETIDEDKLFVTEDQRSKQNEEQRKYGIFYDDDYNYMQHLRSLTETASMVKASDLTSTDDEVRSSYGGSVDFRIFSSEIIKKEEHIDPEILASLDEAPEIEMNEGGKIVDKEQKFLEDDFIAMAGGYEPKKSKEDDFENYQNFYIEDQDLGSDFDEYSDIDDEDDFEDKDFDDTNKMDMQMSKGRGNTQDDIIEAQTALILKNFEKGLGFSCIAQQMDEDDGRASTEDYENLKEIILQDKLIKKKVMTTSEFLNDHANRPPIDTSKYDDDGNEEEEFEWKEFPVNKPKFDCVSILSLNSNTRNLPTDIIPARSQKKRSKDRSISETEPINERGLTRRELEEELRMSRKADKASTFKPEDETMEERKNRKNAIKEERKERRQEKKANKKVFSMEKQQMDKELASLSKSGRGVRLT